MLNWSWTHELQLNPQTQNVHVPDAENNRENVVFIKQTPSVHPGHLSQPLCIAAFVESLGTHLKNLHVHHSCKKCGHNPQSRLHKP